MAAPKTVWGIDVGQCALKALKLRDSDAGLQVEAFDIIEHPKILSQPDADRRQLIRNALEQFLARNSVAGSAVAVSVPGQNSFTRFVKLPPVEPRKIPDIVRFEAEQQIPFNIEEVVWRWQTFTDPDSPDVEVGIFAMKRTDVNAVLENFEAIDLGVDVVQMAPLALYNFMMYDAQTAPDGATLLADVGADKTDLVVADGPRIWTRTIQIGGNNFTEALVRAFKLSFGKAEKLKRTAATSKYARQIFQAMRPVFADLVQEIQRSIGYYTSLHRESRFKRLVGLGNGFRLPGLQKFLEQNLNVPVVRIDTYNRLTPSAAVNAPAFTENALSFAVAYGLALQGLEAAAVNTNLLPGELASQRRWAAKQAWFVGAAAAVLLAAACWPYSVSRDRAALARGSSDFTKAAALVEDYKSLTRQLSSSQDERQQWMASIGEVEKLYAYRDFWPSVQKTLAEAFQKVARDQALLDTYGAAKTPQQQEQVIRSAGQSRDYFVIEQVLVDYYPDLSQARFEPVLLAGGAVAPAPAGIVAAPGVVGEQPPAQAGFKVTIIGRTPMARGIAGNKLSAIANEAMRMSRGKSFKVIDKVYMTEDMPKPTSPMMSPTPGTAPPVPPELVDPWTGEDMSKHSRFSISLKIAIVSDGLTPPPSAG